MEKCGNDGEEGYYYHHHHHHHHYHYYYYYSSSPICLEIQVFFPFSPFLSESGPLKEQLHRPVEWWWWS